MKNSKFFFALKSMDHKLSNDVFRMLIRFLVWILWYFQNSWKISEIAKHAIFWLFREFLRFFMNFEIITKSELKIVYAFQIRHLKAYGPYFSVLKKFWDVLCLFVTKTVIFWKLDFCEKSQKMHFFEKINFLKICLDDV